MLENKQREEFGLADEIAEQRRGVTVGVVKVPVTVIERWEEIARKLEGLPLGDDHSAHGPDEGEVSANLPSYND